MKRMILITLVLAFISLSCFATEALCEGSEKGCTALVAGKNTTVDGSILFAKTEDDTAEDIDYLWYIPRRNHAPGSVVALQNGGTIPQVAETFGFFWDQCPGTSFSNFYVNEWGVAFGSNACASKEDEVEEVAARGDLVDGGLAFELRMILAERARTAHEAVELAAKLLDTYGYNPSGRCLHIVGPNEAWQLQMVRGKQYVARRVRDDEVAIIANTYSIREVDCEDRDNYICSPHLIEYAAERGWYDPGSGKPFDFAAAYANAEAHMGHYNTDRQWNMARLLSRSFRISWKEARGGVMPVSVKPDRKLAPQDLMKIFRDHYEGSALDESDGYGISPHRTERRVICCDATHRTTIVQQRSWLPREIGTLVWRALEPPCTSVFVPWYLGVTKIPEVFQNAPVRADTTSKSWVDYQFNLPVETWELRLDRSGSVFKLLGNLVDANYKETITTVRKAWDEFEAGVFELQPVIEAKFLKVYEQDESLARENLTLFANELALKSIDEAKDLIAHLPRTAESHVALGLFHFSGGDLGEAVTHLEKATELGAGDEEAGRHLMWIREVKDAEDTPVIVPVETLKKYEGAYGPRHFTLRDGTLYYQRDERPEYRLIPVNDTTFSLDGYRSFRLRFVAGKNGKITKVVGIYFNGETDESIRDR